MLQESVRQADDPSLMITLTHHLDRLHQESDVAHAHTLTREINFQGYLLTGTHLHPAVLLHLLELR